jgi:aspartate/glutamate racemase
MKTIRLALSLFLIGTLFFSCETQKHISVIVVDKTTKQPIDSVFVQVKAGKNGDFTKNTAEGYTNTAGKFETSMMIGCSFGCYDIKMIYSKKGRVLKEDMNITEGIIELEP